MLVPKGLHWYFTALNFAVKEFIHIDIINVELLIGNPYARERHLVAKNCQLLAVSIQRDTFNFADCLATFNLKLTGDAKLLVGTARDIKHLDHRL